MRFALSLASVLLLGSAAFAEEVAPSTTAPATAPAPTAAPAAPAAPAAKKLPLRVVRVLEDTQQALMFDKTKGTHVLVEMGTQIGGFTVTEIDEDSVTLTAEGGQQIVLAGPDPSWRGHDRRAAQKAAKPVVKTPTAPEDPYADAAPLDPYSDDGVRSAEAPSPSTTAAPITAGEGGVRTAVAPPVAAPSDGIRSAEAPGTPAKVVVTAAIPSSTIPTVAAPTAAPAAPMDTSSSAVWSTTPVDPETAAVLGLFTDAKPDAHTDAHADAHADAKTAKAPITKPAAKVSKNAKATDEKIATVSAAGTPAGAATPSIAAPTDGATVIAKADVTAALGNFGTLANAVRGSFSAGGAHLDAVAPDSLFAKAGLQAGDTITAVNNQPLRSLDDAATLYSRAGAMKSATIQILRAGKPLSLHLAIQ